MGKRGPKPTPTAELAKRGSWRAKTTERKAEVKVKLADGVPQPPKWLSASGAVQWLEIAPRVYGAGYLAEIDADMVGALCESIVDYLAVRDEMVGNVFAYENSKGDIRDNPLAKTKRETMAQMLNIMRDLGMSPTARVGLIPTAEPVKVEDTKHEGLKIFAKG